MYTFDVADKIIEYYYNQIIGKPIHPLKKELDVIDDVISGEIIGGTYNVYCVSLKNGQIVSKRDITLVAKDLELPSPSEALKL